MRQTIIINELVPGLNGSEGLIREHYHKAKKRKEKYIWLIRENNPKKHEGRVRVTYTRQSVRKMDLDNVAASFKHIGDGLQKCGVIKDDSPDILTQLNVRWQKAKTQKQQRTIIEIKDA